jgi:hypothetical protein
VYQLGVIISVACFTMVAFTLNHRGTSWLEVCTRVLYGILPST